MGGPEGGSGRRGKSGRLHVKSEPGLHGVPSSNKVGPVESASDKDANMDQASFADVHVEADSVMVPQQHRSRRAESPPRQEKGKGKRVAENTPDQEEEGGEESEDDYADSDQTNNTSPRDSSIDVDEREPDQFPRWERRVAVLASDLEPSHIERRTSRKGKKRVTWKEGYPLAEVLRSADHHDMESLEYILAIHNLMLAHPTLSKPTDMPSKNLLSGIRVVVKARGPAPRTKETDRLCQQCEHANAGAGMLLRCQWSGEGGDSCAACVAQARAGPCTLRGSSNKSNNASVTSAPTPMGAAINSLVSRWNLMTDLREDPKHRLAIAILGDHINKLAQLKVTFEGHSAPNVDPSVQAGLRDAKFTRNSYGQRALAKILGDNSHRYASMSQGRTKEGH